MMTKLPWTPPIVTQLYPDPNDKNIVAVSVGETDSIVEGNKQVRREGQRSDWGKHVATVPNILLLKWLDEEWARGNKHLRLHSPEFNRIVARKLQDPDYKEFLV